MISDLCSSTSMSSGGYNRRPMLATGEKSIGCTPFERVAWAMLELAIDDTKILARYGLITRGGHLRDWPLVRRKDWRKAGAWQLEPMRIACMADPLDHARLREFWLDETQAQQWCDLCGCRLPARDIWKSILKHHAK